MCVRIDDDRRSVESYFGIENMSHFNFKAKKPSGEVYSSERDVADRYELYRLIRESGDEILELEEKKDKRKINIGSISLFGRIKAMEKVNFARNLGAMLEAGLPLSRGLSVLERQSHHKAFKKILNDIIGQINQGVTFSDSLARHKKVFPQIFISMVHAGEQSGTLSEALKAVGVQMERAHSLERRIKGALIYPGVILGVMIVIAILMFVFVVPTLMETFTELNVPLPITTKIVLAISEAIQHQGLWILLITTILFTFGRMWAKKTSGKKVTHKFFLKIPIIGPLVQEVNTARTARTLSSLLSAGVNVLESVKITSDVIQNIYFKAVLDKAGENIKKGKPMSDVFGEDGNIYPVFFAEMINVGEETGKTSEMLIGVAHYYEDDVEQKTKDMSTVIEPFLMIMIAAAVGFFAVSMISPMYSLVDAI